MNLEDLDIEDGEECFVIPVPPESDEDDEDTELIINILPLEEGLALLDEEE